MAENTFSKYNDVYWYPDCDYKTNERVNLDIHVELNRKSAFSPTNGDLIEVIGVWKICKLLQQMRNK